MSTNKEVFPYEKHLGKEIKDPEIRDRIEKLPGDPNINKALFFSTLEWMLSLLKEELKNYKGN